MARPLGISLGIDFDRIDRDLNKVADKIEAVGNSTKISVGTEKLDGGGTADAFGKIGENLAQGIAAGVRASSGIMAGFAAHIDTILNRVSGAALTLFERIDNAMKFPIFFSTFQSITIKLKELTAIFSKPISDLDLAISGVFGGMIQRFAKVFQALADRISEAIVSGVRDAINRAVIDADRLAHLPASSRGTGGQPLPAAGKAAGGGGAIQGTTQALKELAVVTGKVGLAFVTIPLGIIRGFERLTRFMGTLGSVTSRTFDQMYASGVKFATLGIFGQAESGSLRLKHNVNDTTTSVGQLTSAVRTLGGSILAAFGIVGVIYKATQFIIGSVKAASDLNQTVARSKIVFGDSFGAVEAQANRLNSSFRVSRAESLDLATSFGAIAQGAGLSEKASAGLANQLTGMAANLSASVGIPLKDAGEAIKSGLVGRGIELKGLGVVMDENTTKAYGLARGFASVGGELTKQSEVQARAELIMRGLSFAQGALERNSASAADQFRKAGGGIQEFGLRIGELLLPAITAATEGFNEFLAITLNAFEGVLPIVTNWASVVTGALSQVGVVARNFGDFWKIAQLRVGEFVVNSIAYIETIPANFGPITEWIGRNWQTMLGDMFLAAGAFGTNLVTNFANLGVSIWEALKTGEFNFTWTPLLDGFKAATEQLPELVKPALISVDDEVNRILGDIARKEAARAGIGGAAPGKAGPLDLDKAGKMKDHEYKLASAVEVNSKEAASIIARSQSPGARKDAAREGVDVAKDQLNVLRSIDGKTKGQVNLQVK